MEHRRPPVQPPTWKFKTRLQHCEIWEHNIHRTVVEAYPLENYDSAHAKINRNKMHIVNSLGVVIDNRSSQPYLLIERIPNRFSSVVTLNEPQTLKILYAVFKGLEELQQIYGVVGLNESCICFNGVGKVKIWVNPDLSSFYPILHLKEHGSNENKILYSIRQIVSLVEKKCFNPSFLKPFLQKLNERKITEYRQASEEILKMGEMLFIVVEEKLTSGTQPPQPQKCGYTTKFQNAEGVNCKKQFKCELDEAKIFRKQITQGHCRKFSNHQTTYQANHRRYQSFVEPQTAKKQSTHNKPIPHLALNLNKLAQSQALQVLLPQIHKSAPLSPREDTKRSFTKNSPQLKQNGHKSTHTNKTPLFQKKQQNKSIFCQTVNQDIRQFDDSFSQNLRVDEKQILVSGDFQTFGILEDLSDSCNAKKKSKKARECWQKENKNTQNQVDYDYDFDIRKMEMQIEKRLEQRMKEEKKRTSIRESLQTNEKTIEQKPRAKLKTLPYENEKEKENCQFLAEHQAKRGKSPHFLYIDQKYEQYIHKTQLNQQVSQRPPQTGPRVRNQVGHFQERVGYNYSKISLHSNNSGMRSPKQGYRIPTDR